jgi:hypothetical protein
MDIDSDSNSYKIEPTIFNSDADSDTNCDADSGINYNANSITRFNNACKTPTQVWLYKDQDYPLKYYLKQLKEFKESDFTI